MVKSHHTVSREPTINGTKHCLSTFSTVKFLLSQPYSFLRSITMCSSSRKQCVYRNHLEIFCEAGEISQLRVYCSCRGLGFCPSTHITKLTAAGNSSYRGRIPSSGLHEHLHVHGTHNVCRHTQRVGGM